MANKELIRNFSIIAHIDHGKSTLADRILELTSAVSKREMEDQVLDNMDIERERGITIKARAVKMNYNAKNGKTYEFNLIDTPGHVDFNYEVSRSLAACEGALLVVDATQGVEAQTLANAYLAIDNDLEIMPVINKIDLASADIESSRRGIEDIIGVPAQDCVCVSAKTGQNVDELLERIITDINPPVGDDNAPLKALIFDSYYDAYRGVVVNVRIIDGKVKAGTKIKMMNTKAEFDVVEVGYMSTFGLVPADELSSGEVGYITASIKNVSDTRVGDTVTEVNNETLTPFPGFKQVQPMVFAGIYPEDGSDYEILKEDLAKLQLNDASLSFEPETSVALGFGFRCGFLGLLHMEIIEERLEREFDLNIITTAPSVIYKVIMKNGEEKLIDNPAVYPSPEEILQAYEPVVDATIMVPSEFVGPIMDLCKSRRGIYTNMKYIDTKLMELRYTLPLNEIIYDFFDALKSRSRGYASLDYKLSGYNASKLVKLDILINGEIVDALSFIVFSDSAYPRGRKICESLKENIPRQLFEIPVQAAIGGKIIARETVRAFRKDVLAKCYGGDITRKKKLLEKQKEGKKKMRKLGSVEVPPETFAAVLKLNDDT